MASVKLTNVKKIYGKDTVAVQDFNLDIADKEFIVFVGPSGCGKSTTLRMIAGLEDISDGTVEIDGVVVNDLEPRDRDIAMVFQNYALYPHLTVFENMAFSLRLKKVPQDEVYERVTNAAEILGITEYLCRLCYLVIYLVLRNLLKTKAERHILKYREVRIKRVVLEYHCDISVTGLKIVYYNAVNFDRTSGNVLKTCDHTKSR